MKCPGKPITAALLTVSCWQWALAEIYIYQRPDGERVITDRPMSGYELDPALVRAVIQVESHFNPHAVSNAGAVGLMQLMASTAAQHKLENRFDPGANIDAGAKHLKYLMQRFDGELKLVLAAYNAGATTVDQYGDVPPFPETRQFVARVLGLHLKYRQAE